MTSAATHDKIQRLRGASIFASTPTTVLVALADAMEEVQLAPNQQLFAKGDFGTSMYVIVAGLVRVHIGDQTVGELADGEIVGELAALDPEPLLSLSERNRSDNALPDRAVNPAEPDDRSP